MLNTDEWDGDKSNHEALHAVDHCNRDSSSPITGKKLITPIGEVYFTDYSVMNYPVKNQAMIPLETYTVIKVLNKLKQMK